MTEISLIVTLNNQFNNNSTIQKSIGFTMVNMSAKFDEEAQNGLVGIRFTAYFHTCPLWPWP